MLGVRRWRGNKDDAIIKQFKALKPLFKVQLNRLERKLYFLRMKWEIVSIGSL